MSTSNSNKKNNKNTKALFSVICLCIISLGLIVYLSTNTKSENKTVNEQTTITESTTDVQHMVTVTETTTKKETTTQTPTTQIETTTKPVTMQQSKTNTPYKSFYKYPLSEAVAKGYSEELVFDETMGDYRAHAGVDFVGAKDDKVVAVNDGLVTNVYTDDMYGMVVEIDHGGTFVVRYCGLESASVKKGTFVDIGNAIGTLGSIPCETSQGAHLHLEATYDGKTVNPLDVMGKTE